MISWCERISDYSICCISAVLLLSRLLRPFDYQPSTVILYKNTTSRFQLVVNFLILNCFYCLIRFLRKIAVPLIAAAANNNTNVPIGVSSPVAAFLALVLIPLLVAEVVTVERIYGVVDGRFVTVAVVFLI